MLIKKEALAGVTGAQKACESIAKQKFDRVGLLGRK
jgi:hypothetical protein